MVMDVLTSYIGPLTASVYCTLISYIQVHASLANNGNKMRMTTIDNWNIYDV